MSLSAAQVLSALRGVLRRERRYLPHVLWVFQILYTHLIVWWEFWAYREVESWSLVTFVLVLVNPGLIYIAANALVDSDERADGSWEVHFFEIRRPFFVISGAILVGAIIRDAMVLDIGFTLPHKLPELILLAVYAAGAKSNERNRSIVFMTEVHSLHRGPARRRTKPPESA